MEQCWNKVGTALRTSRLTSLVHLPEQECPKYGPKGPTKWPIYAENSLLAAQMVPQVPFKEAKGGPNVTK